MIITDTNLAITSLNPGLIKSLNSSEAQQISFAEVAKDAVKEVNQKQQISGDLIKRVESGESEDLVGAMIASQKASIAFDTMLAVRNKMMSAYQDIMKMPL